MRRATTNFAPRLLTAAELARRCGVPDMAVLRMLWDGSLSPDATTGRTYLFSPEKIGRLRELIAARTPARMCFDVAADGSVSQRAT